MSQHTLTLEWPAQGLRSSGGFRIDAGRSLAPRMRLDGSGPRWFDAPPAHSWPHRAGSFSGSVLTGASCNCRNLQLTPHASGTHTESVGHLTGDDFPVLPLLPITPQPALLLRIAAQVANQSAESSDFRPQPDDSLITAAALRAAWPSRAPFKPVALVIALAETTSSSLPPYLSRECAQWLVTENILHLVVEQPSIDRLQDDGQLTAHRVFFGLPPRHKQSTPPASNSAARSQATVTELAAVDADIPSGFGFLQIQAPAIDGDAIPTRPIWHALVEA